MSFMKRRHGLLLPILLPSLLEGRIRTVVHEKKLSGRRPTAIRSAASVATPRLDRTENSLRERFADLARKDWITTEEDRQDTYKKYYRMDILADHLLGVPTRNDRVAAPKKETTLTVGYFRNQSDVRLVASGFVAAVSCIVLASVVWNTSAASYLSASTAKHVAILGSATKQYTLVYFSKGKMFLRALRHVKVVDLILKIMRKCVIIEIWRHIWTGSYNATHFLWKGTLKNVSKTYQRFLPEWIRRGIRSTFQSMVQGHVHGAFQWTLGGIPMDWFWWQRQSSSSPITAFDGAVPSDPLAENTLIEASVDRNSIVQDAVDGNLETHGAQMADSAMESALDVTVNSLIGAAADSMADGSIDSIVGNADDVLAEVFLESVDSAIENAIDTGNDMLKSSIEAALEDVQDAAEGAQSSSIDSVIHAIKNDILPDAAIESTQSLIEGNVGAAVEVIEAATGSLQSAITSAMEAVSEDIVTDAAIENAQCALESAASTTAGDSSGFLA